MSHLVRVPFLLEDHVAEKQGCWNDLPDGAHFLVVDAHDLHGLNSVQELFPIVRAGNDVAVGGEEGVVLGILQDVFLC